MTKTSCLIKQEICFKHEAVASLESAISFYWGYIAGKQLCN